MAKNFHFPRDHDLQGVEPPTVTLTFTVTLTGTRVAIDRLLERTEQGAANRRIDWTDPHVSTAPPAPDES